MNNPIQKTALMAAVILGSAAFLGAAQAAPIQTHATTAAQSNVRLAASEKKEIEGTKADVREDKAEAAKKAGAMEDKAEAKAKHMHHKMKHAM